MAELSEARELSYLKLAALPNARLTWSNGVYGCGLYLLEYGEGSSVVPRVWIVRWMRDGLLVRKDDEVSFKGRVVHYELTALGEGVAEGHALTFDASEAPS